MEAEEENGVKEKFTVLKSNKDTSQKDEVVTGKKQTASRSQTNVENLMKQKQDIQKREQVLAEKSTSLESEGKGPTMNGKKATESDENNTVKISPATRGKNSDSSNGGTVEDKRLQNKGTCVENSVTKANGAQEPSLKMCKPKSDPDFHTTKDQKSKNSNPAGRVNGQKMCKSCSDSDMKSIQDLKSKIDSARASGKSINALLYSMDNEGENNEEEKTSEKDVKNGACQPEVSSNKETEDLSKTLEKLTVENTEEEESVTKETAEDSSFLSKGPMIGYPKHSNLYQPFNIQNRIHKSPPQQVPGVGELGELDLSVEKFYDEESLLKALDCIVPESSPEHYPTEYLPNENFTEALPLPTACSAGVNNHLYLDPTHNEMQLPRTHTVSMPSLPGNFMQTPCTNSQQRSTSADAIKKMEYTGNSIPCEPRPNSYPSTHNETIEELFEYASDIIDKDLRKANQAGVDQRLTMPSSKSVPGLQQQQKQNHNPTPTVTSVPIQNSMPVVYQQQRPIHQKSSTTVSGVHVQNSMPGLYQKQRPNPLNSSTTVSSVPVPRSQPPFNQGNQTFARVMAVRPPKGSNQASKIHPQPREVPVPKSSSPFQEGSNGNLPNILCEVTDHSPEMINPVCIKSTLSQNMNGNNFMPSSSNNGFPVSHYPMAPQINNAPRKGGPQIQQNMPPFPQNPTFVQRLPLSQISDVGGLRPKTGFPQMNGQNPVQMMDPSRTNNSPPSQNIKMMPAPQQMVNNGQVYQGFAPNMTNDQIGGLQPMCNPNIPQQGPMKVYVVQPQLMNNDKPKPRFRKILPKPVEGGK